MRGLLCIMTIMSRPCCIFSVLSSMLEGRWVCAVTLPPYFFILWDTGACWDVDALQSKFLLTTVARSKKVLGQLNSVADVCMLSEFPCASQGTWRSSGRH